MRVTGQLGRVGVIGGSEDYTGAPYFSAMASARLGCDMVGSSFFSCLSFLSVLFSLPVFRFSLFSSFFPFSSPYPRAPAPLG